MNIDKIIDQINYNLNEHSWYEIQDDLEQISRLVKMGLALQALFDTYHEEGWIRIGGAFNNMCYEGIESIEEWFDEEYKK